MPGKQTTHLEGWNFGPTPDLQGVQRGWGLSSSPGQQRKQPCLCEDAPIKPPKRRARDLPG